ncbi:Crp/Fnr family transcriptional regulator [Variovorax sp. OV329]|uniref:Crp/Fnr family transcriptional regulator n=1 Tax=Variovorax sp. OV329 TaxID=1882825 RepID=UPI0008E2A720|nr:Crp/Fnr family transcriptional regulator [Variovorax sp. OV329]SFM28541.1 cAMP-binding domain of CRP or a regulatory subunit of cAMP-dependent protein kinases [Variovorax sp. OV329]
MSTSSALPPRSSLGLRSVQLFEGLAPDRLDALAQACQWRSLPAGRLLVQRAERESDVHFVINGEIRVTIFALNGRQLTFREVGTGGHFGELAAIDGEPRSADVLTLRPSLIASLGASHFLRLLQEEPGVGERVMRGLCRLVRQISERVIDLSTLGVQNRVHAELLRLAREAGCESNRARLDPAPTHAEMASRVSTNREQVTRELNALQQRGLLAKEGKALLLCDVEQLEQMVAEVRGAG